MERLPPRFGWLRWPERPERSPVAHHDWRRDTARPSGDPVGRAIGLAAPPASFFACWHHRTLRGGCKYQTIRFALNFAEAVSRQPGGARAGVTRRPGAHGNAPPSASAGRGSGHLASCRPCHRLQRTSASTCSVPGRCPPSAASPASASQWRSSAPALPSSARRSTQGSRAS